MNLVKFTISSCLVPKPSSRFPSPPLTLDSSKSPVSPKSSIKCSFWRQVKEKKRSLAKATISEVSPFMSPDSRPHALVLVEGVHIRGLLDSGASISCLGHNGLDRITQLNIPMKKLNRSIQTADGAPQAVLGSVEVKITYLNKTRKIRLYLVPSLSQELYLGIDFWNEFGLAPVMIEELTVLGDPTTDEVVDINMHELSPKQKAELDAVKLNFLSSEQIGLGKTPALQHRIDVGNATPVKQRHHFVSPAILQILYSEVDSMLSRGIIEESRSAWSSPVLVVKKPDGKKRFCLDCRAVNKLTVKDAYPMPIIDGIFASLNETVYISSIDLKEAFWQVELEPESRDKTAFTVPGRPLYQFVRMPFGLCNAPQTLCRLMDKVIPSILRDYVFVYMDDLLVVSKDFDEHLERLKTVAKCLREANLTINVRKSKFCMKEIKYLGHIVGHGCIKPDPGKVDAISNFPIPRTVRQVRSFLGMCGWYNRYIANFAATAAPLTDLLAKHSRFLWNHEAQSAFDKLKSCLISAPVLSHPDFSRPFFIQCDASKSGVGGVLYQIDENGEEHPIAYMSKKLNAAQRNYCVTELECLAAILCLLKFRGYVEGMKFTIVTDHASLKWLMSQKDLSGRLARWSLSLQGFDFAIEHRKGTANVVPDVLSRVYVDELQTVAPPFELDHASFDEPDYSAMRDRILANSDRLPDLQVRDRQIYIRTQFRKGEPLAESSSWKLWVPSSLTVLAIESAHLPPLASHPGVSKTLEKLKRTYHWPKMAKQVEEYVGNCAVCKETKAPNITLRPPMGRLVEVERPWQQIYVDLLGPYPRSTSGNTSILIVLDKYSKFVLLKPLRKASASEIVRFLERDVFHMFGVPETVWSDNGVQFISKDFKRITDQYGFTHVRTASHSPQSNASERVNRSLLAAIRAYIDQDQQTWDVDLSAIGSALRNNVHESTGYSPHYLVFGQHFTNHGSCYRLMRELNSLPESDVEVLAPPDFKQLVDDRVRKNLQSAYQRHEKAYNSRSRDVSFVEGQEVFCRNFQLSNFSKAQNAKLGKQWLKCRIVRKLGSSMYELQDLTGKRIKLPYHAKDIKQ